MSLEANLISSHSLSVRWRSHGGSYIPGAWFAVQTKAARESFVATALEERGYRCFVPRFLPGRSASLPKALFPGYLFCQITENANTTVVSTPGVIRIVSADKTPLPVSAQEMEAIRKIVHGGCHAEPFRGTPQGSRVRISAGPLNGVEGIIQHHDSTRLIVSIVLLNRSLLVTLTSDTKLELLCST